MVRSEPSPSKSGALIAGSLPADDPRSGFRCMRYGKRSVLQRSANAPDAPVGAALAPASRDVALPLHDAAKWLSTARGRSSRTVTCTRPLPHWT